MAHYQAGNFDSSINLFCNVYQSKYPNEIFGYLWCARSWLGKDSTLTIPGAADSYEQLAQKAMSIDSAKYKNQAVSALFVLTTWANDVKKDPKAALGYVERILVIDPANPNAPKIRDILQKAVNRPAQPRQETKPKPKTTTKSGGSTSGTKKKQ
jgi:hypothetical protein